MDDELIFLFAGDFVPPDTDSNIYSGELQELLRNKDFSIVNLEAPLTNSKKSIRKTGKHLKIRPDSVKHVKDGYFDAVSLSNNHIRDFGDEGVVNTLNICNDNNVYTFGAGKNLNEARIPLKMKIKGKKISLLNYSEREFNIASKEKAGANPFHTISAYNDIKRERPDCDYLIVIYHGGLEHYPLPLPGLRDKCKFMVDCGVDAIVCHHPHVVNGFEFHNSKPIFYSIGNFCFAYKKLIKIELHQGMILKLIFSKSSIGFEIIGIYYNREKKKIELLEDYMIAPFYQKIQEYNDFLTNDIAYERYWEVNLKQLFKQYYIKLAHGSSILSKIIKKLGLKFYNGGKIKITKVIVDCDSHREVVQKSYDFFLRD